MSIEIRTGDFEAFFQAPFEAYEGQSYVSPLKADLKRFVSPAENPLFDGADDIAIFTAHRDDKPIGRITAHVHRASNDAHGLNTAYFGYFDCADDAEAARALLTAAEEWAKARGFDTLVGNFNLTAMQMIGVQTGGFDHPAYSDCMAGPPHLPRLLEANGFKPFFPMSTYDIDLADWDRRAGPARTLPTDLTFAPITRRTLAARLDDARQVLNESFSDNPMFVPVSKAEYDFQAKDLKWVMDMRLSAVVHSEGKPVGALIAIPDLNPLLKRIGSQLSLSTPIHYMHHRLTNRRMVVVYYGVLPAWRGRGLTLIMLDHVLRAALKAGYRQAGGTWISEENIASLRQKEKLGARTLQSLHLFRKSL
ncbi:N-acetyltransferase family protein [Aestuariibius sp. 2305UL40-4]|uniref:N-acetyltransferase family protein n=1 Tax=Aestuariibius violaceus TaxID=3234132 RepID=UPI00345E09F5